MVFVVDVCIRFESILPSSLVSLFSRMGKSLKKQSAHMVFCSDCENFPVCFLQYAWYVVWGTTICTPNSFVDRYSSSLTQNFYWYANKENGWVSQWPTCRVHSVSTTFSKELLLIWSFPHLQEKLSVVLLVHACLFLYKYVVFRYSPRVYLPSRLLGVFSQMRKILKKDNSLTFRATFYFFLLAFSYFFPFSFFGSLLFVAHLMNLSNDLMLWLWKSRSPFLAIWLGTWYESLLPPSCFVDRHNSSYQPKTLLRSH